MHYPGGKVKQCAGLAAGLVSMRLPPPVLFIEVSAVLIVDPDFSGRDRCCGVLECPGAPLEDGEEAIVAMRYLCFLCSGMTGRENTEVRKEKKARNGNMTWSACSNELRK